VAGSARLPQAVAFFWNGILQCPPASRERGILSGISNSPPSGSQRPECWICGNTAELSREHFPKKADTRSYLFKTGGQAYRTDAAQKNERIQGPGSDRLRWGAPICTRCNNAVTQPYDRAWDAARDYLLTNWEQIVAAGEFDLRAIFPRDTDEKLIDLQLYLVKVLGCLVVEQSARVDTNGFIKALLHRQPHPLLRLIFADCSQLESKSEHLCYVSDLHVTSDKLTGKIQTVQMGYVLRPMSVQLNYATIETSLRAIPQAWHPLASTTVVRLAPPIGEA